MRDPGEDEVDRAIRVLKESAAAWRRLADVCGEAMRALGMCTDAMRSLQDVMPPQPVLTANVPRPAPSPSRPNRPDEQ